MLQCSDDGWPGMGWNGRTAALPFGADYPCNVAIQAGNSGLILATPSDPRTVGVTFRTRR